ncbi:MAG: site-2 protease family protein [Candidatus Nezhaarchaeales archaeon]
MSFQEYLSTLIPLIVFLALWGLIVLAYYALGLKRVGFDLKPYLLLFWRIKSLERILVRVSLRRRVSWLTVFDIGVAMGVGMMLYTVYFLVRNLLNLALRSGVFIEVAPPVPGLLYPWEHLPHVILALSITIFIHELAHGIALKMDGIPIKSMGVFLFTILPGGFVEPDEGVLVKSKAAIKLRVFAAGSFLNMVSFFIVLLIVLTTFQPAGALIVEVIEQSPAEAAGIEKWSVIYAINNIPIRGVDDLVRVLGSFKPRDTVMVNFIRPNGVYDSVTVILKEGLSGRAFLGVRISDFQRFIIGDLPYPIMFQLQFFVFWLIVILQSVALFNMLPLPVFDGGSFVRTIIDSAFKYRKGWARITYLAISNFCVILLLTNILATMWVWGWK